MTEGTDAAGPPPPPAPASPTNTGGVPEEKQEDKPEETQEEKQEEKQEIEEEEEEAAAQKGESAAEEGAEGGVEGGADDGEHMAAGAVMASCCVCVDMQQVRNCVHSEKICVLPIVACLLSLALCTAGLKWVFVDKIFEYEPPTHLDPKRIGQDPIIISADPTLGLTVSVPRSSPSPSSLTTALTPTATAGRPIVYPEDKSTQGPPPDPSVTLKYNAERPSTTTQTPRPKPTQEINDIFMSTVSSTTSTTTTKTSSHVTRCSDSKRNFCVNGGECFTLEIMPGSTKFLCRCSAGFTGHRCERAVLKKVSDQKQAEELYQKRILTISGICIALLVVGIMCVVAYCKTKKQRKKLQDRLRQRLRKKRNSKAAPKMAPLARGRHSANMPLQDLQLVNQCNGTITQHAADKDTETTFSTSKYALSPQDHTTFTHVSSQRFEPLNSPPLFSPGSRASLTPGSPPSESSAPLSTLAISVPSVALSPLGEEERPLLLLNKRRARDEHKRSSAHYNHGHVAHSLPPSPLLPKDGEQATGEHDGQVFSHEAETNNNINDGKFNDSYVIHVTGRLESSCDSMLTDEGEQTAFFPAGSPSARRLRDSDSGRTNQAASHLQDKSLSPSTKSA